MIQRVLGMPAEIKLALPQLWAVLCELYTRKNIWVHASMVLVTLFAAFSGLDYLYFSLMRDYAPWALLIATDVAGLFLPVFFLFCYVVWYKAKNLSPANRADIHGINASIIIAFCVALLYKALSGRSSPHEHEALINNSTDFHIGFMQGEMLGGWPSSHATIAFAIAAYIVAKHPDQPYVRPLMYGYSALIAFGVAIGFHWLSEAVSGAMLGILIGTTVAKHYQN
jgi:membrane-associated phospholipid phosphatase